MRAALWAAIARLEAALCAGRSPRSPWLIVSAAVLGWAWLGVSSQEVVLEASALEPVAGYPALRQVRLRGSLGDEAERPPQSQLQLFEARSDPDGGPDRDPGSREERRLAPLHLGHPGYTQLEPGRYAHWGEVLLLAPRPGAHYRARYPGGFGPEVLICAASLAFLVWAPLLAGLLRWLSERDPRWVMLWLALLTLALRLAWGYETGLVDGVRVGSLPFSDAAGWQELSEDFARGTRLNESWRVWDARRPLAYVINGSWMALFGQRVITVVALNALCSALSAALIFATLRLLAPFPIALLGALAHATSRWEAAYATTTLSEPSGYFLSNLALWVLALTLCREARGQTPRWGYLLGAVLISASNLSRPLTLLSGAAIPLAAVLVLWRQPGRSWRTLAGSATRAGGFALVGLVLCVGPWLVRQRLVHGLWSLSDNTAEMFYSASSPEHGAWSGAVPEEASARGLQTLAERSGYFGRRFRENLREQPGFYAQNVARSIGGALVGQMSEGGAWIAGLLLLALWGAGRESRGEFLLYSGAALAAALALLWQPTLPRAWPWAFVAGLLACARGARISLLALSLGLTLLSLGLVAAPYPRFTYSLRWLSLALEVWGLYALVAWSRGRALEAPPPTSGAPETRTLSGVLVLLGGVWALGLVVAGARHLAPAPVPPPPATLPAAEGAAWRASALAAPEARDYASLTERLVVRRFRLRPAFSTRFAAGERVEHFTGLFGTRPYARSYFLTRPPLPPPTPSLFFSHASLPFAFDPSEEVEVVALGAWVPGQAEVAGARLALFEVVAFAALSAGEGPEDARWRFGSARERVEHARYLTWVEAAHELYPRAP